MERENKILKNIILNQYKIIPLEPKRFHMDDSKRTMYVCDNNKVCTFGWDCDTISNTCFECFNKVMDRKHHIIQLE